MDRRPSLIACVFVFLAIALGSGMVQAIGQQAANSPAQPRSSSQTATDSNGDEPDEPLAPSTTKTLAEDPTTVAWKMLQAASQNPKPQVRIDAVTAAETLGGYPAAQTLVRGAMADSERDVRLAAVVASGTMRDRKLLPDLRKTLDDRAPAVSYAAAAALWKMHDPAGEDILYNVLDGERKTSAGFVGEEMHQANRDLHSPSTLALVGAEQGASALLGPFSIGLDVARMVRKGPSATSARVLTANMLAEDKSDATRRLLISVLHDKDYFVRAAAARGLGNFHGKEVTGALLSLFDDRKPAVRFAAAAAYIRATGVKKKSAVPPAKQPTPPVPGNPDRVKAAPRPHDSAAR